MVVVNIQHLTGPYQDGVWRIHVELPVCVVTLCMQCILPACCVLTLDNNVAHAIRHSQEAYPYKSPSIGFINKIYHPNVDEMSGSVCLDVINQTWSPMFGMPDVAGVAHPALFTHCAHIVQCVSTTILITSVDAHHSRSVYVYTQICSTSLRHFCHNCSYTPTPPTP